MISIIEYLENNKKHIDEFNETMNEIELDMVLESFQCSILQEIRAQIESIKAEYKKKKEEIDSQEWEKEWQKPRLQQPPYDFNKMFVFNSVMWDKITDDQVKEFTQDSQEGAKLVKRICSNRSNSIPGMIVLASSDPKYKFNGIILKDSWNIRYYSLTSKYGSSNNKEIKPSEAVTWLTPKYWTIEIHDDQLAGQLKNERAKARFGSIKMGDPEEYKNIAQANFERYKRLAEKKRIEKASDDGIYDKVMDYVQKVMDVAEKFAKEPIKYASKEYNIQMLLDLIGDRQRYDSGSRKSYGKDGLIYLFNQYLNAKLRMAKGEGSKYVKEDYEKSKKLISGMLEKIDKMISDIEHK